MINSEVGDRCFADSIVLRTTDQKLMTSLKKISIFAEVDGMEFDSLEYESLSDWLQDIVKRVQDCALGQLNFGKDGDAINKFNATQVIKIKRY